MHVYGGAYAVASLRVGQVGPGPTKKNFPFLCKREIGWFTS